MRKTKRSETPWVNEYPIGWDQIPLHALFSEHKNKNKEGLEQNLLSLSYGNIIRKDINSNEGLLPESFNGYNIVDKGDIVLRLTDLQNDHRSLRTGLVTEKGIITSAYVTLRSKTHISCDYYHYLLHAFDIMKVFYSMGEGIRQSIGYDELAHIILPCPPIDEQYAIVHFLDEKCSAIDEAIEKHKKIIEKLEDYFSNYISYATTGRYENEPTKPCDNNLFANTLPVSWNIINARRIIKSTQNGLSRRDLEKSEGQIVLKLRNIGKEGQIIEDNVERIYLTNDEIKRYSLNKGDFLFVRVNGSKELVGKCVIYNGIGNENIVGYNDHIIRIRLTDTYNKGFFLWFLLSKPGKRAIADKIKTSAGQYTINGEDIRDLCIPCPPFETQCRVVDKLNSFKNKYEYALREHRTIIKKLEEYKKSIIYNAVTGKIDCREEQL